MDEISLKYQQEAQNQLNGIASAKAAFEAECKALKDSTEEKIAALDQTDPLKEDKANKLKLELKKDLNKKLVQFEKDQRHNFTDGIVKLEDIFHEKEVRRMKEIEQEILSMT